MNEWKIKTFKTKQQQHDRVQVLSNQLGWFFLYLKAKTKVIEINNLDIQSAERTSRHFTPTRMKTVTYLQLVNPPYQT